MNHSNVLVYAALLYLFYTNATQPIRVKIGVVLLLSLLCVFVEYETFLKKQNLDFSNTALYFSTFLCF